MDDWDRQHSAEGEQYYQEFHSIPTIVGHWRITIAESLA
jgi:hypothetical protein